MYASGAFEENARVPSSFWEPHRFDEAQELHIDRLLRGFCIDFAAPQKDRVEIG